jgi:xanthine dehydrogenase accessory factor
MNLRFYDRIIEWTRAGRRVAVVTIVETRGSTPRKPGTKMLVTDRMELYGTIGGGCVEADVIFAAREVLRTLKPRLLTVDIKAKNADEIDMLCGGEISLYVEPVMPDIQLLICGGGHISKALAHVCKGLDFRLTIVDDREAFANGDRFPDADQTVCCPYEELAKHVSLTAMTYAVVVTRGHSGDEVCLRELLRSPAVHIAMIGSRAKWANLRANLREAGFSDEDLARVKSPAGLDIGSITPEEIAISVAAELIQARAGHRSEGFGAAGGTNP